MFTHLNFFEVNVVAGCSLVTATGHDTGCLTGSVDFKGNVLLVADAQWQCWTTESDGGCVTSQLDRKCSIPIALAQLVMHYYPLLQYLCLVY